MMVERLYKAIFLGPLTTLNILNTPSKKERKVRNIRKSSEELVSEH